MAFAGCTAAKPKTMPRAAPKLNKGAAQEKPCEEEMSVDESWKFIFVERWERRAAKKQLQGQYIQ